MIFNIVFLVFLKLCFSQVQHTALDAIIVDVKISPIIKAIASKHIFQASYPALGYEIAGNIYETNQGLQNDQIHNINYYKPSTSCQFYNSQLNLQQISAIDLQKGLTIEAYFVSEKRKSIYLIVSNSTFSSQNSKSNRIFIQYQYTQTSFKLKQSKTALSISDIGLNDNQNTTILINMIGDAIIVTDGYKIVMINPQVHSYQGIILDNNSPTNDGNNGFNEMIQFEIGQSAQDSIVPIAILGKTFLRIYNINLKSKTSSFKQQFAAPLGKTFTSAVIHSDYYLLTQKQLVVYRQQKNNSYKVDYIDLQSQECWQLNKYESTIHMICKESSLNYVAEFYYNHSFVKAEEALKLNRYYNQIDDAKLIFRFGSWENPKLLIAGDYDQIMTSFAINRQIILESSKYQTIDKFKALGVEDIETVTAFGSANTTFGIGVGTDFLYSFKIIESPSSIQCLLQRKDNHIRWNILVQINTTSCLANGDIEQLQSICRTLIPYSLYVSLFQIDSSRQFTVNLAVYVLMFIIGVVIIGCAMKCKKWLQIGKEQIKKKIDQLKNKKEMKAI